MKKYSIVLIAFAFFFGVTAWVGSALSQAPTPGQQAPAPAPPPAGQRGTPGSENGIAIFQTQCFSCHGNPKVERAQSPNAIREMRPERIYDALATGLMKEQSAKMSDVDKRLVAEFMSGRPLGSSRLGDAKNMPNQCRNNPALTDPTRSPSWNGWSPDVSNSRFQPASAARLTADQVSRLKLKWAFGFPAGISANAQPTIA